MITCENCLIRKRYAILDAHFDWRDCPYACEYAKEQVKEEMKRSEANAGDSISRQAAIEHLKKRLYETALNNDTELPYYEEMADNRVSVWLEEVPTIDPVKHGKWIKMVDSDGVYWACSECGEDLPRVSHYNPQFDLFPRLESIDKTNCCPNCGVKMERSKE